MDVEFKKRHDGDGELKHHILWLSAICSRPKNFVVDAFFVASSGTYTYLMQ